MAKNNQLTDLAKYTTPKMTKYIPHTPTVKQAAFLILPHKEAFYGGAAGGGKSDALLMAALQYVDTPGYRAIIFRRTYADLTQPGALLDRAREWLAPFVKTKEVRWVDKDKTYIFPSGATLSFGYMETKNDKYKYQGGEYQFIAFDELTQIHQGNYEYMFSRLRRLESAIVPLRVRSASNPGGMGHDWVKRRFLEEGPYVKPQPRIFIPATLEDNPHLDRLSYMENLRELDPITRAQLMEGNWNVRHSGSMFDREWFQPVNRLPSGCRFVRYWDTAATMESELNPDPDYTVGLLLAEKDGCYYVCDIIRFRGTPAIMEEMMYMAVSHDGKRVPIWMEQEPGASGIIAIDHYARGVFKGYMFKSHKAAGRGSKELRASPVSTAAQQGRFFYLRSCPGLTAFFEELEAFPQVGHDDQVDALSGAFDAIHQNISHPNAMPKQVTKTSAWMH